MKTEAHSEPTNVIHSAGGISHFHMLAVAKRAEFDPKPLPVMNFCGTVRI